MVKIWAGGSFVKGCICSFFHMKRESKLEKESRLKRTLNMR